MRQAVPEVTKCGHMFCRECIRTALGLARNKFSMERSVSQSSPNPRNIVAKITSALPCLSRACKQQQFASGVSVVFLTIVTSPCNLRHTLGMDHSRPRAGISSTLQIMVVVRARYAVFLSSAGFPATTGKALFLAMNHLVMQPVYLLHRHSNHLGHHLGLLGLCRSEGYDPFLFVL